VKKSLLEAADAVPGILKKPVAMVRLLSFGDSALVFDLLSWTDDPENQVHLQSEINYKIEAIFRREKIQIPFPQRDVHLQVSPALDLLKSKVVVA
jgi:potassium efflux system protein